jgi:hypothetical protein
MTKDECQSKGNLLHKSVGGCLQNPIDSSSGDPPSHEDKCYSKVKSIAQVPLRMPPDQFTVPVEIRQLMWSFEDASRIQLTVPVEILQLMWSHEEDKCPFKRKPIAQVLRMPPEIQIAVPVEILQLMWPDEEDKCHSKVNSIAQVLGGCLQNPIPVEIL